ncbi:hypothetical protein QN277_006747 [Acacia crassicarpa]|uniref:Uncharacterized protein n=1 Tax=Acacia crassicarpa TaxID=499986 RepID=A0AAE1ITG4_9FABA|nr:hypothetical protein QN277_006747 [Acacia crassicarpa]
MGFAVSICGVQSIHSLCYNPEVRLKKKDRLAGVLENEAEGKKYAEHAVRKFVRNRAPEIMPSINFFFADPTRN